MIIYKNNDITITTEVVDENELKVDINDIGNLIWISRSDEYEFKKELTELLDKYRI